ncbi:hypothetical protein HNR00_001226 [Methylorubrum rhodinum]|uniref:Uncharacterized protein n=1 Tax=Methylorubrum rhodinum TaxID=29428 RepID=A0A840ZH80_9HYPH|nr:hypothetical protein [Methylorubrum rhodinum]MBB5756528.1 hypothetical protein [Methylorubrum rhodinum]
MTAAAKAQPTAPVAVTANPLAPQPPTLILFGRDGGGRPRAAWFDASDAEAATSAAATMQLSTLPVADEAGRDLAQQLARGRVLPNGRAQLASTKPELVARIAAMAEAEAGQPRPSNPPAAPDTAKPAAPASPESAEKPPAPRPGDRTFVGHPQPQERAEIGLGSVVLALEAPGEGWWEAEVIGINGAVLSLRWCDYPTQPTLLRKATELALLPAGAA